MTTAEVTETVVDDAVRRNARPATELEQAVSANPNQVFYIDPDDTTRLRVLPERNSRPTPAVGAKELAGLMSNIADIGQHSPALAVLAEDGVAELYAGFRRARAVQSLNAAGCEPPLLLKVIITDEILTEDQVRERSLSENVYRTDMTMVDRINAIKEFLRPNAEGETTRQPLTVKETAARMNMSTGSVSTYYKFDLFPPIAKKAMVAGTLNYAAAEKLSQLLPDRKTIAAEAAEGSTASLDIACAKIEKELVKAKEGKVNTRAVDSAVRSDQEDAEEKGGGKTSGMRQRTTKQALNEMATLADAYESDTKIAVALNAFQKFLAGGSTAKLAKTLDEL